MPVFPEILTAPLTEQDRSDLQRLYADAPQDWHLGPAEIEQLLDQALARGELWGGRFNGRLLGAACLHRDPQGWKLSYLCVRALTRRRGVGSRLVDELLRRATEAGCSLSLQQPGQAPRILSPDTPLRALWTSS